MTATRSFKYHVFVTSFMFVCFIAFALLLWSEHNVIFTAITFLYSMVMSHLWLIKRRDQNKTQEPKDCELSAICTRAPPELMLVATGIMLISLGVAIFVFRPDWRDLAFVAFMVSSSTAVMLIYLKLEEIDRKSLEKFNDASNLV
ncbi:hypothetical protein CFC21_111745 [Triticum aestivum]|uniref:Uncharacterized protein n=2 Tax=Triticum aestivum TaxID=4565 RepID=A0A3B6TYY5_WHEAT|nr:uncharacterized protein LOC123168922 isoform X2 [Triticum aestivum]KAF7111771.1 hypothetical protein CFC21_111745 [Triticum aestivum]